MTLTDDPILDPPYPVPQVEVTPDSKEALAIASGFLVVRGLVSSDLLQRHLDAALVHDPAAAASEAWGKHLPFWMRLVTPAIAQLYVRGAQGALTPEQVQELARQYTAKLGDDLDRTSAAAIAEGFRRQLDARWSEPVAWQRVIAGYGLDRPRLLAWLGNVLHSSDKVQTFARGAVDQLLLARAMTIGDNEAWRAQQTSKVLAWSWLADQGLLATTNKIWRTARDERTCPVCSELDGQTVDLSAPFTWADGSEIYAPPAHPRCRCNADLAPARTDYDLAKGAQRSSVFKAYDPAKHPRGHVGNSGQYRVVAKPPLPYAPVTFAEPAVEAEPVVEATEQSALFAGSSEPALFAGSGPTLFAATPSFAVTPQFAPAEAPDFGGNPFAAPGRTRHRLTVFLPRPPEQPTGHDLYMVTREDLEDVLSPPGMSTGNAKGNWNQRRHKTFETLDPRHPLNDGVLDFDAVNASAYSDEANPVRSAWAKRVGPGAEMATAYGQPDSALDSVFWSKPGHQKLLQDARAEAARRAVNLINGVGDFADLLDEDELRAILSMAGRFQAVPEPGRRLVRAESLSYDQARGLLLKAFERDETGRYLHDGIATTAQRDAFMDYVAWTMPDQLGTHGRALAQQMKNAPPRGTKPGGVRTPFGYREPPVRDIYLFQDGMQFDNATADYAVGVHNEMPLVGKYRIARSWYVSAPEGAAAGVAGFRYCYLAPTGQMKTPSADDRPPQARTTPGGSRVIDATQTGPDVWG